MFVSKGRRAAKFPQRRELRENEIHRAGDSGHSTSHSMAIGYWEEQQGGAMTSFSI
jgi:hypothetical protein